MSVDASPAPWWRFLPAAAAAALTAAFASRLPEVAQGATPSWALPWFDAMGVAVAFRLDGLSLAFALLVCGVGAAVFLYAAEYFRGDPRLARVLTLLSVFALAMLGLVTADDAISLFVFWELTTVTSFLLVAFDSHRPYARAAARQALLVTGLGGLALLAGLIVLAEAAGTWRLSEMAARGADLRGHALYFAFTIPILLGCFTKSAQFPFHFWLPGAMAAPTPVSAYLHSATMVKAGVYLLARLSPELGGTEFWNWTLTLVGGLTMLIGAVWALRQTDLKLMLAHTTVSGLGSIVMFLGSRETVAIAAACTFIVVHAFYKAALFMVVGSLDRMAGTRELPQLGGLGRAMPASWTAAILAGFSMAGFPPLLGFIGKELKYEGALAVATEPLFVAGVAVTANALIAVVGVTLAVRPFTGARAAAKPAVREAPLAMWLGPAMLATGSLAFGVAPGIIDQYVVQPMAITVSGAAVQIDLKLWHGVNIPLLLSILTFGLALAGFFLKTRLRALLARIEPYLPPADNGYTVAYALLLRAAAATAAALRPGRLDLHLLTVFGFMAAMLLAGLALGRRAPLPAMGPVSALEAGLALLVAAGALYTPFARRRLAALGGLGVVGSGVAALFALAGGVDLAMTQLLVETLIVVIVAVALLRLPQLAPIGLRPGAALIAGATGAGATLAVLAALSAPFDPKLTAFFEAASWPEAYGRNIVNVILVDFRAFDTLGEIMVVALAAIAALAALAARRRA